MSAAYDDADARVALLTGGSRGIGFAFAEELLKEGIKVFVVVRDKKTLTGLQEAYPELLRVIEADLSTCEGQMKVVAEAPFHIHYVIHNAAVINPLGPEALLDPASMKALATLTQVNIMAPTIINAGLGERIRGARVLMVSSRAGDAMVSGLGAYCAAKTWMDVYMESLQMDKPKGVLAAAVHPGDVDTGMQEDLRKPAVGIFPKTELFREWKAENKLLSPKVSADYLTWLLLRTDTAYFTSMKHDIYNVEHHSEWLRGRVLPFTK